MNHDCFRETELVNAINEIKIQFGLPESEHKGVVCNEFQ